MSAFSPTKLRRFRCERGLTIKALAFAAGVDITSISHWETRRHVPTGASIGKLARALGVAFDDLFEEQAPVAAVTTGRPSKEVTRKAVRTGDRDALHK